MLDLGWIHCPLVRSITNVPVESNAVEAKRSFCR